MRALALVAVLGAVAGACSDLPPIAADQCGNGAIDPGEDCDGPGPGSGVGSCAAPGTTNACHYVCDRNGSSAGCPTGYACGIDSECRLPTGQFTPVAGQFLFGAVDVAAGDVDGDGIDDLIGTSQAALTVLFGSPTGALDASDSQNIIPPDNAASFRDVNGDGHPDVMFPTEQGLVTFLADGRTYEPLAYSSIHPDVPVPSPATDAVRVFASAPPSSAAVGTPLIGVADGRVSFVQPLSEFAVCFDGSDAGTVVGSGAAATCSQPTDAALLVGHRIPQAATGFAIANAPTGEQFVLAVNGGTKAQVFTPGLFGSDAILAKYETIDVGSDVGTSYVLGGDPDAEILFGNFDDDGCVDLLLPVYNTATATNEVAIAFGASDAGGCTGEFGSAIRQCPFGSSAAPGCGDGDLVPIGAADLDGDGLTDVVFAGTIATSVSTGPQNWSLGSDAVAQFPRPWTEVVAADYNHDGRIDLAGIVRGADDVDVLLNVATPNGIVFDPVELPTDLPIGFIDTADFDGDTVPDLAVAVGDTGATGEQDHVLVAFGTVLGAPTPFVDMGAFDQIIATAPASLTAVNALADLVVVDITTGATTPDVAVLQGSTTRRMVAPLIALVGTACEQGSVPIAATPGEFIPGSSGEDVAMLVDTQPCTGSGSSGGPPVPFGVVEADVGGEAPETVAIGSASVVAFDFGDARYAAAHLRTADLLFAVQDTDDPRLPHTGSEMPQLIVLGARIGSGSGGNLIAPVGGTQNTLGVGSGVLTHALRMVDLDGSGFDDHALIEMDDAGSATTLVYDLGSAGLGSSSPVATIDCGGAAAIQIAPGSAAGPSSVLAMICPLDYDPSGGAAIAFLDGSGAAVGSGFAIPAAVQLVSGDFNGDGIADLAVVLAGTGAIQVYLQCSHEDPCGSP